MDEEIDKLDVSQVRTSFQNFTWIDYAVFVFMLSICGGIGVYFGFIKKQNSAQDYLMGGRNMSLVPVTCSLVASFISGISLLGTPTELYIYGTSYFFILSGAVAMAFIVSKTFLPVFYELQLTSAYEYLELRFNKKVRAFGSVLFSIFLIAWLPIVIYVPALAFNQVTGVNIHIITPIVCLVCIFYTSMGGLKAVVWTDVVQTIAMFVAMLIITIKGSLMIGGFQEVINRNYDTGRIEIPSFSLDLTERHTIWSLSIGSTAYWLGSIAVSQSMMQRFLALPTLKTSIRAVWGFLAGLVTLVILCGYSGLVVFAKYKDCDPLDSKLARSRDQLLPLLVMDVLGDWPGMPGLFVAGVFSAALSSLSTGLNSMAAVVLEDFWKPFFRQISPDRTQIFIKAVVIILGLVCVALVFVVEMLGPVLQLTMSLNSATVGPQLGIFIMGIFMPFIDASSALSGGFVGLGVAWWVAAQAQLAQANGKLMFDEKPRFINNCTYNFPISPAKETLVESDIPYLYRMSYLWYMGFGCMVTVVVACMFSLRPGTKRPEKYELRLYAPILRTWLTKLNRRKSIELTNGTNVLDREF